MRGSVIVIAFLMSIASVTSIGCGSGEVAQPEDQGDSDPSPPGANSDQQDPNESDLVAGDSDNETQPTVPPKDVDDTVAGTDEVSSPEVTPRSPEIVQLLKDLSSLGVDYSEEPPGTLTLELEYVNESKHDQVKAILPKLEGVTSVKIKELATDDVLKDLATYENLQSLDLKFNKTITDAGVAHIAEMKNLRHLDLLYVDQISPAAVAKLASLTKLESLGLGHIAVGNGGLAPLATLTKLQLLDLSDCDLDDADLAVLTNFPELRELNLEYNILSPSIAQYLAGLKHLEVLNLHGSDLDDAALKNLADMTNMRVLNLRGNQRITDAGLVHLAKLTNMEFLNLGDTSIVGFGLENLAGMTKLRHLELGGTEKFDGVGLRHLAGCSELQELNLSWTGVGDAGLADVKHLQQLTKLDLPPYGHKSSLSGPFWYDGHAELFTDAGLKHISEMPNLEWLWIGGSGPTDAGIAELGKLTKLTYIGFGDLPNVKGPGLAKLKPLTEITMLGLKDTGVTDENMKYVEELTQLTHISLPSSATDAALKPLAKLKNLEVVYYSRGLRRKGWNRSRRSFQAWSSTRTRHAWLP